MATKKPYEIVGGHALGVLPKGMTIPGTNVAREFSLREYTVADLIDAETEASAMSPITFNAHLLVRQFVQVGDFKGPFTINMVRALKPADWRVLRAAQQELEELGEAEPDSAAPS
jgi:phage FluMu protein gp41